MIDVRVREDHGVDLLGVDPGIGEMLAQKAQTGPNALRVPDVDVAVDRVRQK